MEQQNLCCLVDVKNQHVTLDLVKINEVQKRPEVDSESQNWKDREWGWRKIGKDSGTGHIRFVFDWTNFDHLKRAIEVAQDFQR